MSIEYAVHSAVALNPHSEADAAQIAGAEREMGAFLRAVQRSRGSEAARRAANYWIEAFESSVHCGRPDPAWRRITITAASRLARDTFAAISAEQPA